jgi:FG-GAP-like repeat
MAGGQKLKAQSRSMTKRIFISKASIFIIVGVFVLTACQQYPRNRSHAEISSTSIERGQELAKVFCQSCHLLPDPSMLDSRSWEKGVLPAMGPRLGIFMHNFERYPNSQRDTNLAKDFYPSQPLMKPEEWQAILDYYTATSPDTLMPAPRPKPIKSGLPLFSVAIPSSHYEMPATTLVQIDTTANARGLFIFDVHYRNLYRYDPALRSMDSMADNGGLVDLVREDSGWIGCNIGVLNPNNGKFGKLEHIGLKGDRSMRPDTPALYGKLARPVQIVSADLNQDGRADYLVCEFGNMNGALSWLENKGGGKYERHVIRAVAGAIRAYVGDFNHDGLPDIMALFAQGDEGIFLFTNKGKGVFSEQSVLRFPPMYGSSYFELADFNKDGHPDILYTCGDNADFSPVLKPYHGVYIYMNDGKDHFTQQYFYPIDGCFKAMARDFDGDGDLDIATISFFGDYNHQPEEGFVYLENNGGMDFQPYSLPETQRGKWLTMDAADLDGDGKTDIVLGNFSFFAPVTRAGVDFKKGPPFMLLKNRGKGQ